MASPAQIDANRLNAQKSTGPTTGTGKDQSRRNAVKHGAYATAATLGIDPQIFADRRRQYQEYYAPIGVEEEYLVSAMLEAANEIDICSHLESAALAAAVARQPEDSPDRVGNAILEDAAGANALLKISRRKERAHRKWVCSNEALKDTQRKRVHDESRREQYQKQEPNQAPQPAAPLNQPQRLRPATFSIGSRPPSPAPSSFWVNPDYPTGS